MAKKSKLSTPEWIKEGYDSPEEYAKAKGISKKQKSGCLASYPGGTRTSSRPKLRNSGRKTFNIRECPKCGSDNVKVVIGENGIWECHKCGWKGEDIVEKELNEDEFMKYLDDRGEEVA